MVYVAEYGSPSSIGAIEVTSVRRQMHADRIVEIAHRRPKQSGVVIHRSFPPRPF
jgi:hypothetical protein